ncbi:MAG: hypothetical protein V7K42_02185 [Nostoc sp.]
MQKRQKSRFLFSDRWLDRHLIVRNIEAFQDLIVIVLCLGLFAVMLIQHSQGTSYVFKYTLFGR